jgi:hypothetical protein
MIAKQIAPCAIVVTLLTLAGSAQDQPNVSPPPVPRTFLGNVVMIRTSDPNGLLTLENPTIQRLGSQDFVVGMIAIPPSAMRTYEGRRMWIPVASIIEMLEFGSTAEATAVLAIPNSTPRSKPISSAGNQ